MSDSADDATMDADLFSLDPVREEKPSTLWKRDLGSRVETTDGDGDLDVKEMIASSARSGHGGASSVGGPQSMPFTWSVAQKLAENAQKAVQKSRDCAARMEDGETKANEEPTPLAKKQTNLFGKELRRFLDEADENLTFLCGCLYAEGRDDADGSRNWASTGNAADEEDGVVNQMVERNEQLRMDKEMLMKENAMLRGKMDELTLHLNGALEAAAQRKERKEEEEECAQSRIISPDDGGENKSQRVSEQGANDGGMDEAGSSWLHLGARPDDGDDMDHLRRTRVQNCWAQVDELFQRMSSYVQSAEERWDLVDGPLERMNDFVQGVKETHIEASKLLQGMEKQYRRAEHLASQPADAPRAQDRHRQPVEGESESSKTRCDCALLGRGPDSLQGRLLQPWLEAAVYIGHLASFLGNREDWPQAPVEAFWNIVQRVTSGFAITAYLSYRRQLEILLAANRLSRLHLLDRRRRDGCWTLSLDDETLAAPGLFLLIIILTADIWLSLVARLWAPSAMPSPRSRPRTGAPDLGAMAASLAS